MTRFQMTAWRRDNESFPPCNFLHGGLSTVPRPLPADLRGDPAPWPHGTVSSPPYLHNELLFWGEGLSHKSSACPKPSGGKHLVWVNFQKDSAWAWGCPWARPSPGRPGTHSMGHVGLSLLLPQDQSSALGGPQSQGKKLLGTELEFKSQLVACLTLSK